MENGTALQTGMDVVGSDKGLVGIVYEIREQDFQIDRRALENVYAPFSAVTSVQDGRVELNVPAEQVGSHGWETT